MTPLSEKERIDILLENYKLINEESKSYLTEMLRCFPYTAVVIAIGLGYGDKKEIIDIINYMPFALLGLMVYFLSLGFMYVNTCRYKAQIEEKISTIAKEDLFEYESKYKPEILRNGLLPIGKKSKRLLPVPNFFLGLAMIAAFLFLIHNNEVLNPYFWRLFIISIIFGATALYVFLLIPRILEKHQKRKNWIK